MVVLVIAPHPDDEVLGCGGTMAKYISSGDEVYVCVVTKGYEPEWSQEELEKKHQEAISSGEILGIKEIYFLNYPTVRLDTIPQVDINKSLATVVKSVNPEIIYVPFRNDINIDHRIVFDGTMVVTRPVLNLKLSKILAYETLSETEWGIGGFNPNVFVNIESTIQKKLDAMSAYQSELKEYPHPRSLESIINLARFRGSTINTKAAEAFMLIREIC